MHCYSSIFIETSSSITGNIIQGHCQIFLKNPDQLKKVSRTLTQFLEVNKGIEIIRHKSITQVKKIHDLHGRKSKLNIYLKWAQGNYTSPCNIKS